MKTVKKILITMAIMAAILLVGFGINRLSQVIRDAKFEKERAVRHEEVEPVASQKKEEITQISQLSKDEIKVYIEENAYVEEEEVIERTVTEEGKEPVDPWSETENFNYFMPYYAEEDKAESDAETETVENETLQMKNEEANPEDGSGEGDSENSDEGEDGSGDGNAENSGEGEKGSGGSNAEGSGDGAGNSDGSDADNSGDSAGNSDGSKADNTADNAEGSDSNKENSRESAEDSDSIEESSGDVKEGSDDKDTGSDESGDSWSALSKEENVERVAELGKEAVSAGLADVSLKERQSFRSSEEETQLWIEADNVVLENTKRDYSGLKIACLGDSITEATNLDDLDNYEQYSYPTRLKEVLGAESVVNLGIGGSSLGRYWDQAFCERYTEIPEDTDIIFIMGGDNDGYCLTEDLVGSLEDRSPRTLYGDVDELMRGLKENYPDAKVVFMTPMPNLLHDVLRKERPWLLSQTVVVNCIKELAEEYEFDVIDLYNSNFFDSHDAEIVADYIPDSVHPNEEGYEILARHIAAELIRIEDHKDAVSAEGENAEDTGEDAEVSEEGSGEEENSEDGEASDEEAEEEEEDEVIYDGSTEEHSNSRSLKKRIDSRLSEEDKQAIIEQREKEDENSEEESEDQGESGEESSEDEKPEMVTYARDEQ
ncbi:MAG: hypothetical protein K6A38_03545 [Lachnospiraceae bacterium]|nr:hypothetical protein [Lachnospiraceae bacterium]